MNAQIHALRTELNEAIYTMIDADSDKRYNMARRQVSALRSQIVDALEDYLYSEDGTYCLECGNEVENVGDNICDDCAEEW